MGKRTEKERPLYTAAEAKALKAELLSLAKAGKPRPKAGTRLGNALVAFTTSPEEVEGLKAELGK